ncbi:MAG: NAD(P)/FAD-dependent oxidoreductase [Tannerella sp.]|jgi:predicted Rossmann fold flavoprotein|nr:NAD(P)/FAD-dependent oxidoreductase [Tannerella sp.]
MKQRVVIVGGGAAGFFLAANIYADNQDVIIIEQARQPLQKVRLSGGGRCNLTHACFEPHELVASYPRGSRELLGVFSRFQPADTIQWFENKGVMTYTDDEGCVFPVSDSSLSVVDVLMREASRNGVEVRCGVTVKEIVKTVDGFEIKTDKGVYISDIVVITTGSSRRMWEVTAKLGHNIIPPVPSLFSLVCRDNLFRDLAGTVFANSEAAVPQLKIRQSGTLLITHHGLSGPVILRVSAFGARELNAMDCKFDLKINWLAISREDAVELLKFEKRRKPAGHLYSSNIKQVTSAFWKNILQKANISDRLWADLSNENINHIAEYLTNTTLKITGRNTMKEEFVTAGGVDRREIDFKTMQSKIHPNLYFAGETIDIDGLTGGYNFQACWSEAYIISRMIK